MRERVIGSYGYLAEDMMSSKNFINEASAAIMNYSTFEEQFIKQNKGQSKKCARRRIERQRSRRYSDIESDTGSDGLAVNSSGSGRSGDWAPPRRRIKPKSKRRSETNSLTDSGISLSKGDSESLSGISCQRFEDDVIHKQIEINKKGQRSYDTTSSNPAAPKELNTPRRCSLRRSSSCSALPSDNKLLDRHNPRLSKKGSLKESVRPKVSVEEQENAILNQCFKNEGLITQAEYSNEHGDSYIFDCSHPLPQSKFPLPDHLNYPLNKYRHKSEFGLNRSPVKPLRKLKDGWKKLKARSANHQERNSDNAHSTISSTVTHTDYLSDEDDNEAILARLSTTPNESKSFLKKIFNKVGTKTYTAQDTPKTISEISVTVRQSSFQRSSSTRSIPDALKNMWNKVHELEPTQVETTPRMSRAFSMPSIAAEPRTELPGNVMYFNEPEIPMQHQYNYFSNFFKPIEAAVKNGSPSKPKLCGGNDVITGVLGKYNKPADDTKLVDAELTSGTDNLKSNDTEKEKSIHETIHNDTVAKSIPATVYENRTQQINEGFQPYSNNCNHANGHISMQQRKISQSMYTSSFDLSSSKSHFYNPQSYYSSHMPSMNYGGEHCSCCSHQAPQYPYYYPPQNYVYGMPVGQYIHPQPTQNIYNESLNNRETIIVAPLDVHVSIERKAERRKISDMVFDTFV